MKKVFIAAGCPHATVTRYRCIHLQEQFALLGIQATVQEWSEELTASWVEEALRADLIILQRVPINATVRHLMERCRQLGKRVAFDTDDLVFEPQMTGWHRGVATLSAAEQALYHTGIQRYLATLEASDFVITASPLLAELAQRRGQPAFVHRNAVGEEMQQLGDQLFAERNQRKVDRPGIDRQNQRLVIGYGSGTPTHDVDFEQAALALVDVMTRHPLVELWLVGPLQLPSILELFQDRIQRFPLTDWQGWFQLASQFDISLAPLEQQNLFCRAKSEIKFVEAGLLGVPTVASRIDPFEYAIQDGENGLLAGNVVEWMGALDRLVTQPALREKLALAARRTVEEQYSAKARSADLAHLLEAQQQLPVSLSASSTDLSVAAEANNVQIASDQANPGLTSSDLISPDSISTEPNVPLVINWLVSEPFQGSGGHLGIFRMVKHLVDFGHDCHIYILPVHIMHDYSTQQLREYVDRYFLQTGATFHRWQGHVGEADATVATYWKTVAELQKLPNPGRGYYLVQDFEPYFYAVGTEYLLCENTYRAGLHCLTLGPWLEKFLRGQYKSQADHFAFAIDSEIYTPQASPRQPWQRVLFYARPSTPRRGYELGIAALEIVKARKPDVEIVLFGANELPPLPFQYTMMGIRSPHELATLYTSSDVGLVLSLTNPSFVPFEMMACGCAVVDIRSERLEGLLEHRVNAMLAEPTPAALADAVLELLESQPLRQQIIDHAFEQVSGLSWRNSARQIEAVMLRESPAIEKRVATRRMQNSDASAMLWQIHQLLAQVEKQDSLSEQLQETLKRLLLEKAEMAQKLQGNGTRPKKGTGSRAGSSSSGFVLRKLAQPLPQKLEEKAQLWSLGQKRLRMLFLSTEPYQQHFCAEQSHLSRLELLFYLDPRIHSGAIRCTLVDETAASQPLIDSLILPSDIQSGRPFGLDFEPQTQSYGRSYRFALSVEGRKSEHSVAVWHLAQPIIDGAVLRQGSQQLTGQLAFQPFYLVYGELAPGKSNLQEWGETVQHMPAKLTQELVRLATKTAEMVRSKGVSGLYQETVNYIRWQKMQRGK